MLGIAALRMLSTEMVSTMTTYSHHLLSAYLVPQVRHLSRPLTLGPISLSSDEPAAIYVPSSEFDLTFASEATVTVRSPAFRTAAMELA